MPKLIGRLEERLHQTNYWQNYGHTTKILGLVLFLAGLISAVGYFGVQTQNANKEAKEAKKEVIKVTQSPCSVAQEHPHNAEDLAKCRETFHAAVRLIGPQVSCEIIQSGATWLVIGGQRIQGIECLPPPHKKPSSQSPHTGGSSGSSNGSSTQTGKGDSGGRSESGSGTGGSNQGAAHHDGSPGSGNTRTNPHKPSSTSPPASAPTQGTSKPAPVSESSPGNGQGDSQGQEDGNGGGNSDGDQGGAIIPEKVEEVVNGVGEKVCGVSPIHQPVCK